MEFGVGGYSIATCKAFSISEKPLQNQQQCGSLKDFPSLLRRIWCCCMPCWVRGCSLPAWAFCDPRKTGWPAVQRFGMFGHWNKGCFHIISIHVLLAFRWKPTISEPFTPENLNCFVRAIGMQGCLKALLFWGLTIFVSNKNGLFLLKMRSFRQFYIRFFGVFLKAINHSNTRLKSLRNFSLLHLGRWTITKASDVRLDLKTAK